VRQLPTLIAKASSAAGRQVVVSTHADDLLADEGVGLDEVAVLRPGAEGTTAELASTMSEVVSLVEQGFSPQEALSQDLMPKGIDRLTTLSFG
jgi:predicted ATPase